jgi:hypothetical protein
MAKGSRRKFTPEILAALAARYETRSAWQRADPSAYQAARRRGLLEEVCAHMQPVPHVRTLDEIKASAARYTNRKAWLEADASAYQIAMRRGVLDEVCEHMPRLRRRFTREGLMASAAQYASRADWRNADPKEYECALRRGLLDLLGEDTGQSSRRPKGYWTLERCKASAAEFQSRFRWERNTPSAYNAALKNGWLEECCAHMTDQRGRKRKWTPDTIAASAQRFRRKSDWLNAEESAYKAAKELGIFDEVTAHMPRYSRKPRS